MASSGKEICSLFILMSMCQVPVLCWASGVGRRMWEINHVGSVFGTQAGTSHLRKGGCYDLRWGDSEAASGHLAGCGPPISSGGRQWGPVNRSLWSLVGSACSVHLPVWDPASPSGHPSSGFCTDLLEARPSLLRVGRMATVPLQTGGSGPAWGQAEPKIKDLKQALPDGMRETVFVGTLAIISCFSVWFCVPHNTDFQRNSRCEDGSDDREVA